MALQGVHVAKPSKAPGEAALPQASVQGTGQNAGNGHIAGPKMKTAAVSHIPPMSDDKVGLLHGSCILPAFDLQPSWSHRLQQYANC